MHPDNIENTPYDDNDTISETRPTDIEVNPTDCYPNDRLLFSITLKQRRELSKLTQDDLDRLQSMFDAFVTIITKGGA